MDKQTVAQEHTALKETLENLFNAESFDEVDSILENEFNHASYATGFDYALRSLLDRAREEMGKSLISVNARRSFAHVALYAPENSLLQFEALKSYRQATDNVVQIENWRELGSIYPYQLLMAYEARDTAMNTHKSWALRHTAIDIMEKAMNMLGDQGKNYRAMAVMRCAEASRGVGEIERNSDIAQSLTGLFKRHLQRLREEQSVKSVLELLQDPDLSHPHVAPGIRHAIRETYADILLNEMEPEQAIETAETTMMYNQRSDLMAVARNIRTNLTVQTRPRPRLQVVPGGRNIS